MAKVVVMPKLGLTMTEGTLSAWKKKEGDAVKEGEARAHGVRGVPNGEIRA